MVNDTMRRHVVLLALAFAVAPLYAQQPLSPPLKNWPSPLYWAPQRQDIEQQRLEQQRVAPHSEFSLLATVQAASIFSPPGPLTFIAMTPCRVMDTRPGFGFTGAFGPPSLSATPPAAPRSVPMPSSSCNIPVTAAAYSLNITAVAPGVLGFLSAWPAGQPWPGVSTLNAPLGGVVANAAIVPAGTLGAIQLIASNDTDVIIDINGYYSTPTDSMNTSIGAGPNTGIGTGALSSNTTGDNNTAIGFGALRNNTTGSANTATGELALSSNTTGGANTANGSFALRNNTTGDYNTVTGYLAMNFNTTGSDNTASGYSSLLRNTTGSQNTASGVSSLSSNTTGSSNTASGQSALDFNTTGYGNTASGYVALGSHTTGNNNTASGIQALYSNTTGQLNIAIGTLAAVNVSGGNSNNIHIGSQGSSGDSGTIRIGTAGTQTSFFAAGVRGVTTGLNDAVSLVIDSTGQLGTVSSSRRFKEDIQDMGEASTGLLRLRPVTYRYKQPFADGSKPIEYGLVAEEVADVYPDLVAHSADGEIETVKYQVLDSMLLNEVQKLTERVRLLTEQNRHQTAQNRLLEDRLAALEALRPAAPEPPVR